MCIRVTTYCSAHYEWLILLVWPTSYETQSGLICLLKLTMAVDNCVFRIIKEALYIIWCGVNRLGDSGVKVV